MLFCGAAALILLPRSASGIAASPPACGWDGNDKDCDQFDLGDKFVVGKLGDKSCPAGSAQIRDIATCQQAQALTGHMFEIAGAQEGTDCHWCGGCTPKKVRLLSDYGAKAKKICVKEASSEPAAKPAAVAANGKASGTPWPDCHEKNTVIRNAGQALFTNLQGYGATIGCFLDDCMSSDKFVASEIESCAKVCFSLPECEYWIWGNEEGEQKCWFRTGDDGREAGEGWVSGRKSCHPPGTQVLPLGNSECWEVGFGYPECCDAKYGPNGNAQCWDGVYNYDRCCFPKDEL